MGNLPAVPDYFGQFIAPLQKQDLIGLERRKVANDEAITRAKIAEAQQEATQEAAFRAEVEGVVANPTPEGFRSLMLRYPKQHEALKDAWGQYSEGQKSRNTEAAASIYGALSNGRNDLALSKLKQRRAALIEGGETTEETDALIELVESGDPKKIAQAKGLAGMVLSVATGPDKIGSTLESLDKIGGRKLKEVDGVFFDEETGEPVVQSPYSRIIPGPDGSFYEQPRIGSIPVIGGVRQEGVGGTGPSEGGGGAPRTPLAVRTNNPGALKDGPFARSQPGYKGSDNGFAVFTSPGEGAAAQETLLRTKYLNKPSSVAGIVNRYAPASENSKASRGNYIKYIEDRLGIAPGQKISAEHTPQLAKAMREFETGNRARTPARVSTAAQYASLPSGSEFYDPKGNLRRKP